MRTSNPDIWVAIPAGIEEASAMVEGRIAGFSAAKALGLDVKESFQRILDKTGTTFAQAKLEKKIRGGICPGTC